MDSAVDQPSTIEGNGVSENGSQEVGVPQSLSPEVPGHQCREHKTHEHHTDLVVPMRKSSTLTLVTGSVGHRVGSQDNITRLQK